MNEATSDLRSVEVFGVRVHDDSGERVVVGLLEAVERGRVGRPGWLATLHVDVLNRTSREPEFRDFLNRSAVTLWEGRGVQVAARLAGVRLAHRLAARQWFPVFLRGLAEQGSSVYAAGGTSDEVRRFASELRRCAPDLRVVGTEPGNFDRTPGSPGDRAFLGRVKDSGAAVLLLGMPTPAREHWLLERADRLPAPLVVPLDAAFRTALGPQRSAPAWMRDGGFEWAESLLTEPKRAVRRYLLGNPAFLLRTAADRATQRLRRR